MTAMVVRGVFSASTASAMLVAAALSAEASAGDSAPIVIGSDVGGFATIEILSNPDTDVVVFGRGQSHSTDPIRFRVTGNAFASVSIAPDAVLDIPGRGTLGLVTMGAEQLGYDLVVELPAGADDSRARLTQTGSTDPIEVDLIGLEEMEGLVTIVTDTEWTPDGDLPPPGTYTGTATLTVVADGPALSPQ